MDGLLVVDKPSGPTSHDVVARMRRVLGERRIGHTGTLDPLATGVLPLVIGRATRLARFLSSSDKSYEAVVRLGFATDTGDAEGSPLGVPYSGQLPTIDVIDRALDAFRGQFLQQPPIFSAKKIAGQPSHRTARRTLRGQSTQAPLTPQAPQAPLTPVVVTVSRLEVVSVDEDRVTVSLDCSAGFYVRALAHDLGERLGTGGHLAALRRTRAGELTIEESVALEAATMDDIIPLGAMLTQLPAMTMDADEVLRALHGRDLEPRIPNLESRPRAPFVRLLDDAGDLVAIAEPTAAGLLHPSVVLR
ncbi:MAG TPA: tRNA pseudouridine(55) synthase TruB [Vicinamibacterales bacterium]|nr:tRNA pseudouridine(55) synthase TruB [Vicinamibacterales bacterium]